MPQAANFNPRSPRGERLKNSPAGRIQQGFQSTLPARGATQIARDLLYYNQFQSTLPARGATKNFLKNLLTIRISIHAPREGSDPAITHKINI